MKFKSCTNYYDCATCTYDQAMGEKVKTGKQVSWQEFHAPAVGDEPAVPPFADRAHRDTGPAPTTTSAPRCDFDQFFEDVWSAKTAGAPADVQRIRRFAVPMDHYFHDGHTWARVESGGAIRVGMDDFALKLLGKADGFELPLMGKELNPGKPSWGLRAPADIRRMCSRRWGA
ncbi:MAG: hypothetical protein MZV70_44855 [Desulfobacterales bacterium]|nr:hypothetical protein [Desulfobacterales bacterium]